MLRTLVVSIAAICTVGLLGAPAAAADMCANHGTGSGQIYKTACATGNGGRGPMIHYQTKDENGRTVMRSLPAKEFSEQFREHRRNNQN